MSVKLPPLASDGEGVLRHCAQSSKLMDFEVPQPVRDFATALLTEVHVVLEQNMKTEEAELLMRKIIDHVLGTKQN